MAMMNKTRSMLEGFVKDGSFKWLSSRRSNSFDEEFEEMGRSPSGQRKWISELSPVANVIVGRCSKILDVSMDELQQNFYKEASDLIKDPSCYARNFLEYCCFRALALSTRVLNHLAEKNFRRLTFDMMIAWETPAASSQPVLKVDQETTVGIEAFSRMAPAVPIIADVVTCSNLFDVLTTSTEGRLSYPIFDKYLGGLDRAVKKMKTQSESSHLSSLRSSRGERILDMDGTLTTQPVLEHVGMSIWPGRLTLTDHALYFEALRVVTYDKPKIYDLADDLDQVVKPELTGPWGARLFDKAVMYKCISLSEPVFIEFPELTGHSRRDYWLAAIREILYVHEFIRKFDIKGVEKDETLSKAVLGILRLQAVDELASSVPLRFDKLLMFNVSDQLPGGDLILETLASMTNSRGLEQVNDSNSESGMYSVSALAILSNMGLVSNVGNEERLLVGELVVGEMSSLEKAVRESRSNFKKAEIARATVDGVKVEGIDTNLAVMMELLYPIIEIVKRLLSLASWSDPLKSFVFCSVTSYVICRGWLGRALALLLLFFAMFMLLTRCCNRGKPVEKFKVKAPPTMNTVEQLLALQNAISQVEVLVQDGNIFLLKLRALLLSVLPQATDRVALALILIALLIVLVPSKLLILMVFLEIFTRNSPLRKVSTDRSTRRLREWWFSIPAAPVILEREKEEKKKR